MNATALFVMNASFTESFFFPSRIWFFSLSDDLHYFEGYYTKILISIRGDVNVIMFHNSMILFDNTGP